MATGPNQARIILSADDQSAAAFAAVSRRFDGLKGQVEGLKGRFDAVLGAAVAALAALGAHEKIELLDQLDKLSEKTGLTVEQLSILRYQGELANVPLDELAKGAQKLAKAMAAAAGGNAEAVGTFKAIGISVKDAATGGLKPFDQILGEVADKFAHYEDGPAKAALAQRLFGKSGADLIPLLNLGAAGLAKQKKEAEELGIVLGGDVAKNASEFNDNMTRLKATSEAAAISIGGSLLPALNQLLTNYLEFKKQGLLGTIIGDAAKDVFGAGKLTGDASADLKRLAKDRAEILRDIEIATKTHKEFQLPGLKDQLGDVDDLRRVVQIKQRSAALENLGDVSDAVSRKMREGIKTQPPIPKDPAAGDNAEAVLKRQLEQRLKQIEDFGALQKLAIEFDNQQAESAYAAGFLSVNELFDKQRQARDEDLKNQLEAFDATIAAQQDFARKALKPEDKIHAETAIQEAQSKRAKAQEEYTAKSAQAFEAERIAIQRDKDAYDALGASVLDLEGKTLEAAKSRIDKTLREDALTAGKAGQDQDVARRKAALLRLDAELADVQKRYGLLVSETADAETLIGLNAAQSGATERDTLLAVGVERQKALVQLRELAEAADTLAKEKGTPEAAAAARALGLELKKATAEADPLLVKTREVAKELGDGIATAGEEAILHWQGFRSLLSAIEQQILQIILRSQVTKPLGDFLSNQLGGGSTGSGGLLGSLLPGLFGRSPAPGTAAVNLGNVSGDDLSLFYSMDTGTNYVPQDMLALVHQGEAIVPKQYNDAGSGRQVPPIAINQYFAPGTTTATTSQAASQAAAVLAMHARRFN